MGYLVGAGDIASCDSGGDEATAALLDTLSGVVFTTGDHVQGAGTYEEWADCYDPTWGRHKHRTRPSPGNHDYHTDDGAPYYDYFGDRAGPTDRGYYSYDLGGWLIISLNSNVGMAPGSAQHDWLTTTLSTSSAPCILAYWHHPRFSSGHHYVHRVEPLWEALSDAGADVVLVGHSHMYERFAPMDARGAEDRDSGMRQFTIGTGGFGFHDVVNVRSTVEFIQAEHPGILQLVLYSDRYEWRFIRADDGAVVDEGGDRCR